MNLNLITGIIKGEKINTEKKIKIPYNNNLLSGEKLLNQLKEWEKYGTIEPSVTEAIKYLLDNPNVTDLSDKYFVLLGAASAMGPFELLISLGANIIAVDINRPAIWKRLISRTRRSSGTLYFPIKKPTNSPTGKAKISQFAGCNLFNEVVEITHWLDGLFPGKELMIGSYVYLDGEKHVRLIMSCDMILQYLSKRRKISIANLCTPTDCHPIPADAKAASLERYNSFSLTNIALSPFRVVTAGRWLKKNMHCEPIHAEDGNEYQIVNAIVLRQGPNYILAKRIQHWRSIVARSEGIPVSTNVAPSTSTASVVHQRSFAWAYDGMPFFPPMEIFEEKTSSALMAALLIHDITNQNAVANPAVKLDNQMEIFMNQSVHGGIWRMAYSMDSITEPSAAVHFVKIFVKSKITHAVTAICVLVPVGYKLYSRM